MKKHRYFTKWISRIAAIVVLLSAFTGSICFPVQAYDNVVIVIDPGHGGAGVTDSSDLGAQYNGVVEKDMTLLTALALKAELEQYGNVTVYLTRAEDKQMSLKERADYAVALGADALVSVHYNASSHHRFYGAEIFTSAFGQNYAVGNGIAQCVMKRWTQEGAADKGIKTRLGNSGTDYYGIIRRSAEANIPAIILEHGYIDNAVDWNRIGNAAYWQHLGQIDAAGIADYFGLQKNVVQASVTPTVAVAVPTGIVQPDLTPPANVSVKIDDYDVNSNTVTYTVSAKETESRLMYFGAETEIMAVNEETSFMNLQLWTKGQSEMTGSCQVPAGFDGNLIIRVYNNYELCTDSAPVRVSPTMAKASPDESDGVLSDAAESEQEKADAALTAESTVAEVDADLEKEPMIETAADTDEPVIEEKATIEESVAAEQNIEPAVSTKTGNSRDSALIGLIAAASVAVIVLALSIAMAVSTNNRRRRYRSHR